MRQLYERLLARLRIDPTLPRFVLVGASNSVLSFTTFMILVRLLADSPHRGAIAQSCGYASGIAWSFVWNRRWTFASSGAWSGRLLRFLLLQFALLGLSTAGIHLAVDLAGVAPVPAWISVTAVVTLLNYATQRRFVFAPGEVAPPALPTLADYLAAAAILATAAGFGLSQGVDDQNTYVLHALVRMRPSFLPGDWLAHETVLYHGTWAWSLLVASCLAWSPAALAVVNGLCTATALATIRAILGTVARELRTASFLLLLGFLLALHTASVGDSRLFTHVLVPQSLAIACFTGAILLFLRGNHAGSGVLQGLAGYLHAHFLVLGPAVTGLALLLLPREDGPRFGRARLLALARQLAPGLLVLAIRLPELLTLANAPGAAEGRRIIQEIRSPHHYLAGSFLPAFVPFLGWLVIGAGGFAGIYERARPELRRFAALGISIVAILGVAFVAVVGMRSLVVGHLYPWRLAPFAVLLAQVAAVASFGRCLAGVALPRGRIAFMAAAWVVGSALVIGSLLGEAHRPSRPILSEALLLATLGGLPLARGLLCRVAGVRAAFRQPAAAAIATGLLLCACLYANRDWMRAHSTILAPAYTAERRELVAWARTTPAATRFLVPPDLEEFRLAAERAIVVDWKNAPMDPAGALEWHRRMRAITGGGAARTLAEAGRDYQALGVDSLRAIGRRFGCGYVVRRVDRDAVLGAVDSVAADGAVHANARFRVYAVESAPSQ